MTCITQNWKNLQPSSYFNSDLSYVEDRSVKTTLTDVFRASIAEIKNVEADEIEVESCLQAAEKATQRFKKAYDASNIVVKVYFLTLNIFGYSLLGSYNEFIDVMTAKLSEKYKENFYYLINQIPTEDSFRKEFFEKIAYKAIQTIVLKENNVGICYKISAGLSSPHYLIGTVPIADYQMIKHSLINKIIKYSFNIMIEIDNESNSFYKRLKNWVKLLHPFKRMKYSMNRSCLDAIPEYKTIYELPPIESIMNNHKLLQYAVIEAWKNGYDGTLSKIFNSAIPSKIRLEKSHERYDKWINRGLLKKITGGSFPTCIIVGIEHCTGEHNLVDFFKNQGLTVEYITSYSNLSSNLFYS